MNYAYIALGALVACLLAYVQGRSDERKIVVSEYATRDLTDARESQAAYAAINERYRAKEQDQAKRLAGVSKTYQKELANAETAKIVALDAVRTGALQLRLTDSRCEAGGSPAGQAAAGAGGRDGAAGGQFLGPTDSAFLIAEASRADAVTQQLTACQAVVTEDRR